MTKRITSSEYAGRRTRLFAALPAGSLAVIASHPEALRNGDDNTFAYRASSDVLYLTGFDEPNCVLIFDKTAKRDRFLMLVQPHDAKAEIWHGKRAGVSGAVKEYGADAAFDIKSLAQVIGPRANRAGRIFYKSGVNAKIDARLKTFLSGRRTGDPLALIAALRLVKSEAELAVMRHSGKVGSLGHVHVMLHSSPGVSELALKGVLDLVFATNGGETSYGTIVAAGVNGLCLHYAAGHTTLADGEMVLIDAGSEIAGYASDISRTFPVSGKFSVAQKELYEVVLAGQMAAIAAVKPGVTWKALYDACDSAMENGLKSLGFAMGEGGLKLSDVMPHGLGHWLGLDVHDVGSNDSELTLAPGMVFTIEPGVYLSLSDERIPAAYRGMCIRIEDNIEVTEDGAFVQTADSPKSVAEIEALMATSAAVRGFELVNLLVK